MPPQSRANLWSACHVGHHKGQLAGHGFVLPWRVVLIRSDGRTRLMVDATLKLGANQDIDTGERLQIEQQSLACGVGSWTRRLWLATSPKVTLIGLKPEKSINHSNGFGYGFGLADKLTPDLLCLCVCVKR